MRDWQAAILAYVALSLIAETEYAPVAVVVAWGLAVEQILEAASGQDFISNLTGRAAWPGFTKGTNNAGP